MLNSRLDERRGRAELLQLKIAKEKGSVVETNVLNNIIRLTFEDMIKTLMEFPNIYAMEIINMVHAEENPKEVLVEYLTNKMNEAIKMGLNNAKQANYSPVFFGVDGMDGILTLEGFDTTLAEGVVLLTPYSADDSSELNQNFVAKYQEKYGEVPNQFAADAYDCVYALYKAATQAGLTADMDAQAMCDAMVPVFTSFTFDGLTGANMTWDKAGAVSKSPNAMVIENGVYVGL